MDDKIAERREKWDALVAATQAFIDSIEPWEYPRIVHVLIGIENKDTQEMYRVYPVRIVRKNDDTIKS